MGSAHWIEFPQAKLLIESDDQTKGFIDPQQEKIFCRHADEFKMPLILDPSSL
jgi:hypothetical protein